MFCRNHLNTYLTNFLMVLILVTNISASREAELPMLLLSERNTEHENSTSNSSCTLIGQFKQKPIRKTSIKNFNRCHQYSVQCKI